MGRLVSAAAIVATFFGAALIFFVEPMIGRMVLPLLGGAPAVWNTCVFFFQVALLAGYAYAHLLSALRPGLRVLVHALLVVGSLSALPVQLAATDPPALHDPSTWLFRILALSVGLPFFVLAATGPLIQQGLRDFSGPGSDPYPLFAWGNAGSLAALLAYPFLIEPWLRLRSQAWVWSGGYVLFAVVLVACALVMRPPRRSARRKPPAPRPRSVSIGTRAWWVLLAFVPSATFLAVTHYMSTDVAVFPLIWVLPLGVYLVTMMLAFARRTIPIRQSSVGLAVATAAVVASFWAFHRPYTWVLFLLHPIALFCVGMVCHARLFAARPEPARLTQFYLFLALGGALGGMFATFVAPACFDSIAEYPILLVTACLIRPPADPHNDRRARWLDLALPAALGALVALTGALVRTGALTSNTLVLLVQVALPCVLVLALRKRPLRFALAIAVLLVAVHVQTRSRGEVLHARRDFFGVHKVVRAQGPGIHAVDASGKRLSTGFLFHFLWDGTTMHGAQAQDEPLRREPTSYYAASGPLGELLDKVEPVQPLDRIAVVGLGAGTIAAYGRPGRSMTFYEIDPEVARIARDPRYFTYLSDSAAHTEVVIGDGRALLARAPDASYDLIVLDAFASDAIPVHLMTAEAVDLYFRKLTARGILAVHVTNQHLDLEPVFHAIAAELGLRGRSKFDEVESLRELEAGKNRSHWIVLARGDALLGGLTSDGDWLNLPLPGVVAADRRFLWTDDYSSVVRVLRPL